MLTAVTENLDSLGESIKSAVLVSWSKQPGDSVAEDDTIATVETDKVIWVTELLASFSELFQSTGDFGHQSVQEWKVC